MDRVEAEFSESPADRSDDACTLLAVAGEQSITRAMWRNPAPSPAIRRHSSACSWLNAGGRPSRFPLAQARSSPSRIRSLAEYPLVGPLGQQRPAEELRRGAPLTGVDVFPGGHDADVAPGKLRLDADAVLRR